MNLSEFYHKICCAAQQISYTMQVERGLQLLFFVKEEGFFHLIQQLLV